VTAEIRRAIETDRFPRAPPGPAPLRARKARSRHGGEAVDDLPVERDEITALAVWAAWAVKPLVESRRLRRRRAVSS
jgi:hypothetical protein